MSKQTLLLVDGNALVHRGYHALPNLTNHEGIPTGAVFGFARLLLAALKIIKPDLVAVTFDSRGQTFRHHLYTDYKANRKAGPDDLYEQLPLVKELVKSLNMPIFTVPGFEADDLIATLAKQAKQKDLTTTILTGDMDLIQLVDKDTSLFAPQKGVSDPAIYTPKTAEQKFTFPPSKMLFYKSLRGDASDNIPGVPGVGEVTAKKLVNQFPSLDDLYAYLKKGKKIPGIGASIQQKLRDNRDQAYLSQQLATIKDDVPVTLRKQDCVTHEFERGAVVDMFVKLDFRSLLKELPEKPQDQTDEVEMAELFTPAKHSVKPASQLDRDLKPVLRAIEQKGVKIDRNYLHKLDTQFKSKLAKEQTEIYKLSKLEFNIDSSRQLADVLFKTLKLSTKGIKAIASGWSTDANQLDKLRDQHKIIDHLITYREIAKLINTYTTPLAELADKDERLHTTYSTNTATGRITSKNPNLQNIPIRTKRGSKLRHAFTAAKGKTLISADYSQIELRVAAHLAKDPAMIAAFRAGKDIHDATSKEMAVDRHVAKIINFSILYGKGPHGFAQDLHVDIAEAKEYIDRYFKTYHGINKWIQETLVKVGRDGYVETLFGWRRYFPTLKGRNPHRYSRLGREAINTPVQGTAAEILKRAMIAVQQDKELADTMVLTVHDELVFEVARSKVKSLAKRIRQIMETTTTLDVPVKVDVVHGDTWGSMTE